VHCSDLVEGLLGARPVTVRAVTNAVLHADRAPGVETGDAWAAFARLTDRVREILDVAFGARALIVNRALNELACEPVDVEGQRPIGLLPETTRVGYLEIYFDHRRWGEEALGGLALHGGLHSPALSGVQLLRIHEDAAIGAP
jgi:hypothetical protein